MTHFNVFARNPLGQFLPEAENTIVLTPERALVAAGVALLAWWLSSPSPNVEAEAPATPPATQHPGFDAACEAARSAINALGPNATREQWTEAAYKAAHEVLQRCVGPRNRRSSPSGVEAYSCSRWSYALSCANDSPEGGKNGKGKE
jgi:hypothetical protein